MYLYIQCTSCQPPNMHQCKYRYNYKSNLARLAALNENKILLNKNFIFLIKIFNLLFSICNEINEKFKSQINI